MNLPQVQSAKIGAICGLKICVSSVAEKRNPPAHANAQAGGMKSGS